MSARRLGRLLGSVLILAALVGVFAVNAGQVQPSGYEWGAGSSSTYEAGDDDPSGYEWG